MKKIVISENEILSEIQKVINENRKVIKLPNQNPQPAPMPDAPMPAAPMPQGGEQGMSTMTQGGDPGADPMAGQMPMDDGGESQFDTNFDAGVEADEDSDPKRYIQQLTGKLSQSINSYNSEQADAGLNKYVASMIIAATCKNLDDKQKKELIEKINGAQSDESSDDMGEEDIENPEEEMPMDDGGVEQNPLPMNERVILKRDVMKNTPINERFLTRRDLMEMFPINADDESKPMDIEKNKKCPKAWQSKF